MSRGLNPNQRALLERLYDADGGRVPHTELDPRMVAAFCRRRLEEVSNGDLVLTEFGKAGIAAKLERKLEKVRRPRNGKRRHRPPAKAAPKVNGNGHAAHVEVGRPSTSFRDALLAAVADGVARRLERALRA